MRVFFAMHSGKYKIILGREFLISFGRNFSKSKNSSRFGTKSVNSEREIGLNSFWREVFLEFLPGSICFELQHSRTSRANNCYWKQRQQKHTSLLRSMLLTCGYPDLMMSFNHQARKIMEHTTCLSGLQFIRPSSSFRRHNVYCLELDSFPLDSSPVIILPYVYSKFLFSSIVVVIFTLYFYYLYYS